MECTAAKCHVTLLLCPARNLAQGFPEVTIRQYIQSEISKTRATLELVADDESIAVTVEQVARVCCAALGAGNKILLAGNGGSAADAQHLAGELVSRLNFDRPGLAAFALTTDTSVLTAVGNDYGYDCVFSRQLNAVGVRGDVFIAISTSGRSSSILRALEEARRKGLVTVGFTGKTGGDMPPFCDFCIRVPVTETPKIQEGHIMLGHIICGLIEREIFGGD
jgi:D-sedoheptulose 7-phosphate isomerase